MYVSFLITRKYKLFMIISSYNNKEEVNTHKVQDI